MKTKKLSKKIRLTSKTLIITVMFLLFSTFPGNAQNGSCSKVGVESNWVFDDNVLDKNGNPNPNRGAIIIDYEKIKMTGTSWVRINFRLGPWTSPTDTTLYQNRTWKKLYHEIINELVDERGIQVYGLIGSEAVSGPIPDFTQPVPGAEQSQWIESYVQNFEIIVENFKDQVKFFESYNEPQMNGVNAYWFAIMLDEIWKKRNQNNWDQDGVNIISGPLFANETWDAVEYMNVVYYHGITDLDWASYPMDGFGLHLYFDQGSTNETEIEWNIGNTITRFLNVMGYFDPWTDKKIYVSEFGWRSDAVEEQGQADNLNTAFNILKADPAIAIAIWFSLIDSGSGPWGLYNIDYSITKPSFNAFRNQTCSPFTSLDLSFVIDSSGSMWDDIANVKNSMTQILNAIETKVDDYRISIVDFKHYYYSDYVSRVVQDFTNNNDDIENAIYSLYASGGADPGEAVYAGLMCAFTNCSFGAGSGMSSWRDDALKIAILLGDEPPYTGSQEFTYAQVVAAAEEEGIPSPPIPCVANALATEKTSTTDGIHIYSILTGNNSTADYYFKKLAEDTEGKFFNALTANDVVDAILEAIGTIPGPGPGPTNSAPDVSGATASVSNIWPPNNKMIDIQILDVVDPDGDPVIITITGITQDEPVNQTGSKNKEPDAEGIGTDTAWVRAERDGNGNGRVYEITFEASDDKGATAEGSVFVCVPHDQGEDTVCINDGQNYDSTSSK